MPDSNSAPRAVAAVPVLLVTGGGRGIGAATAILAAQRGWDVAINYRRDTVAAQAVGDRVRAQGRRALVVQAEVEDEAQVLAMYEAIDRGLGSQAGQAEHEVGVGGRGSGFGDRVVMFHRLQRRAPHSGVGPIHRRV